MTLFCFVNLHVDDSNHFIILLECINNSPVHGKLFVVVFKIIANVIHRNVMSVFQNLYVSMLRIVEI